VGATVTALGIRVFNRNNIGGGYATVELGETASATCIALQFAAGSLPDRAGSLNRFGMLREAIACRNDGAEEAAFAGFITSSKEESLSEARNALRRVEGGVPLALAWGYSRGGRNYAQIVHTTVDSSATWMQSEEILNDLLNQVSSDLSTETHAESGAGFLSVMRSAGISTNGSICKTFLHNCKKYELRTQRKASVPGELTGEIHNDHGQVTAQFRALYDPVDPSGLPIRFEYNPRSFLRLTFESDSTAAWPVPSLLN
jgi:hypothetical protein